MHAKVSHRYFQHDSVCVKGRVCEGEGVLIPVPLLVICLICLPPKKKQEIHQKISRADRLD